MRPLAVVAGLVLSGLAVLAQQETFAPREAHFTIKFPGKPKESTQTVKTPAADLKVYVATYAHADGSVFLASQTEFPAALTRPENHDTLFTGAKAGLAGKDGKLVSEKKATLGGVEGREVLVDKGKQQTRFRMVLKDSRLFQVAAVGTGAFVTGPEVTAFLDSFEFPK